MPIAQLHNRHTFGKESLRKASSNPDDSLWKTFRTALEYWSDFALLDRKTGVSSIPQINDWLLVWNDTQTSLRDGMIAPREAYLRLLQLADEIKSVGIAVVSSADQFFRPLVKQLGADDYVTR